MKMFWLSSCQNLDSSEKVQPDNMAVMFMS